MIGRSKDYAILLLNREAKYKTGIRVPKKIKGYASAEIIGKNFRLFYTNKTRKTGCPNVLSRGRDPGKKPNHEGWR